MALSMRRPEAAAPLSAERWDDGVQGAARSAVVASLHAGPLTRRPRRLARPRRAAEAAAPPTPALHLRGGFDAGFCVRGEASDSASGTAAAAPAAVQAARRAPAFASLSRALFQLAAAPAPTKCVARPRGALLRLRNPTCTFAAVC
jgi:hypothetical protein